MLKKSVKSFISFVYNANWKLLPGSYLRCNRLSSIQFPMWLHALMYRRCNSSNKSWRVCVTFLLVKKHSCQWLFASRIFGCTVFKVSFHFVCNFFTEPNVLRFYDLWYVHFGSFFVKCSRWRGSSIITWRKFDNVKEIFVILRFSSVLQNKNNGIKSTRQIKIVTLRTYFYLAKTTVSNRRLFSTCN